MDHLIGQRFSLISKSEIRYVGTLHEINPEESTIALEDVLSFGTEDRRVENYIPPSQQRFEYIVFRGSDVKDIKIDEEAQEPKQQSQPPNDPAILNSSRPGPPQAAQRPPSNRGESPFPPQNYPPPGYGGFYPPPPPGQFGRGYGPPPGAFGPGPGYPPYGPPPGYFGPPGQGFPQGPNRFPQQQHPPPIGPPGQRQPPPPQQAAADSAPAVKPTPELSVEKNASRNGSKTSTPAPVAAPPQPTAVAEPPQEQSKQPPPAAKVPQTQSTQPKNNRVTPAMPFTVNQKSFMPPVASEAPSGQSTAKSAVKPTPSQAEMDEASRQAKEAVAAAMAKINAPTAAAPKPVAQQTATVDSLTEKVSQLTGPLAPRGRGGYRGGRGARSSSGGQRPKMEIPQSDFDFESSNAKFNKEDLIKEAIATGSPLAETSEDPFSAGGDDGQLNGADGPARKDSLNSPAPAYNKSTSFFDNISSEAKDREDTTDGRMNGRAMRGQEFKKNIETFGQGNVDSGYRGRGRGGYRGRGRANYNQDSNYRGSYRGRGRGSSDGAEVPQN